MRAQAADGHPEGLHIAAQHGHGWGMREAYLPHDAWIKRFNDWLKAQKMLR